MPERMAERGEAPQKRYRFQIELGAHDLEHALSLLDTVINDARIDGWPRKSVSSAGYVLEWEDRDPTMTAERYEQELMAWFESDDGCGDDG